MEVVPGIQVIHTGEHNRGFQIVTLASGKDKALHMVELPSTHAHFNPLWIMAYDNFPLESIAVKGIRGKRHHRECVVYVLPGSIRMRMQV
jgi:hypothetical protein